MQREQEINFFTKSKENINELAQKVDKKPFFKLAFLSIAFGCSIGIGVSFVNNWYHNHLVNVANEEKQEKQKIEKQAALNKQNFDYLISQIAKIDSDNFQQFISYLKYNQNIYDDKINLIANAATQASLENKSESADSQAIGTEINNHLSSYKRDMENIIQTNQRIYSQINNKFYQSLDYDEVDNFIKYYENYKANVLNHSKDMDELINDKLYPGHFNQIYYNQNHIPEQAQAIDKKINDELVNYKPKMK